MPTHGRARDLTIAALRDLKPFKRSGYSMSGVEGAVSDTGRLPKEHADAYNAAAKDNSLLYTVKSYATPIAWVLRDGAVVVPNVKYSNTTTNQQNLCAVYLNK